jgi:anthraniloyl-CoA monooxygenase
MPQKLKRIAVVGGGPGGLYFSILMKKAQPDCHIEVFEQNRRDDTFGFGVVFSDETLGNFRDADKESYDSITDAFEYWGDIDCYIKGEKITSRGHGFAGMGRKELLLIMQDRALELGVKINFETRIEDFDALLGEWDAVIGVDGINSAVREHFKDHFEPEIDWRHNRFAWMGTTQSFPAFTFAFRENEHGIWILGAYRYKDGFSTIVPECSEQTWLNAGLDKASEEESAAYQEKLWADLLDGHKILTNRSIWRRFPMLRNKRWSYKNLVLIGDALHTAHYSIGSGTKLAMEDAIAMVACLNKADSVEAAYADFEQGRRLDVEKTQHAADVSLVWFEYPERFWQQDPTQMAFALLSRAKQITYENLGRRDPDFLKVVTQWAAADSEKRLPVGIDLKNSPPPMFLPFKLRDMTLSNRVVVSPMGMYSSEDEDGTPSDFGLVHYGGFALGGAGLIFVETTHISKESKITPRCLGLYNERHVERFRRITDFVHAQSDSKMCVQLGHAGRKGSTQLGWQEMDYPLKEGNWPIYSASPLPFHPQCQVPIEISREKMTEVREQFVASALLAEKAGFDMVEIHMAHGYLLSSFISPLTNLRTDGYGGGLEARMRYPLEVFDAVRRAWPERKPMSVRISATDWVDDGGLMPEDAVEIAKMLKAHGLDICDVSAGQTTDYGKPVYGRMFQSPFADAVRNEAHIPTITVGSITTADQVNTLVAAGRADLVALGRPHQVNPRFTAQAAAYYGVRTHRWPNQYLSGRDQAYTLAVRDRADIEQLRVSAKTKPPAVERAERKQRLAAE